MSVVLVALIVAVGAVVQIHVNGQQRRSDKREDWDRQDLVAERLTSRQDAIALQAEEAARLLVENNRVVAESSVATQRQLTVIHTLVNSTLTGAKQAHLEALQGQLLLLERFTPGDTTLIDAARATIAELRAELSDRVTQTRIADGQSQGATP